MIRRAPPGHLWPLAAVALTGLPLDQVMLHAVEIEGMKVVSEAWARDYGRAASARWRGAPATAPAAAMTAPSANIIDMAARKPERFLEPARAIIVDGEMYFAKADA